MARTTHRLKVAEARRVRHPFFANVEKHYFTVQAKMLPPGIRNDANARDDSNVNRQVYKDVRDSLLGHSSTIGSFDLMNKGIVILAEHVTRVDDGTFDITIDDGQGIVDGGHTYKIIAENREDPDLSDDQFVEVQVRTGVSTELITDIAKGLNTGIQVKAHSLANLDGKFGWLKEELASESYYELISWREGDPGDYDVRDLLCVLEALNIVDYPNDKPSHPIIAYEKWGAVVTKFATDAEQHRDNIAQGKYYRLRPLLKGGLLLWDTIRHDFRELHNKNGGAAGKMRIIETAPKGREFQFPFSGKPCNQYRLTKGALYPIFAAFRNAVELDGKKKKALWVGGIESVLDLWSEVGPLLVSETFAATRDKGHLPDQLGKSRGHWAYLHTVLQNHLLRRLQARH